MPTDFQLLDPTPPFDDDPDIRSPATDHRPPIMGNRGFASSERSILFSHRFVRHAQPFHNKAVSLVADQITAVTHRINGGATGCGINPASERHGSSDALNPLLVLCTTEAIRVKAHCLRAVTTEKLERCVLLQRDSNAMQVAFLRCQIVLNNG